MRRTDCPTWAQMGADIYLFSAYKTYGPHQGLMVMRRALGEVLPNQGHTSTRGRSTSGSPRPARITRRSRPAPGMADYWDALYGHHFGETDAAPRRRAEAVHDLMRAHEARLLQPLLDAVASRNAVRLIGPADAGLRAPTVALALTRPGEEVAAEMAAHGVMCGGGDFYAGRALDAMGVDPARGVLRLSFVHYTRPDEMDHLLNVLGDVL
jgi:selenocysteine lyase/cysteine desulfurase